MSATARKLLIPIHDLPLGGSERIAVRLANRWAEMGREVTLFCGDTTGPLAALIESPVQVIQAHPVIPRAKGSRRRLGRATAALLAARPPDLVFVPGNYQWPLMLDLNPAGPPVVAQIGTPLRRPGRGPLKQVAYDIRTRRQFRHVAAAVSLSAPMTRDADRMLGRGITHTIRLPALDDAQRTPTRAEGRLIVAAGRLEAVKGFDLAIRAIAALGDPTVRLAIVGEGPLRADLADLAAQLGVSGQVDLPGYAPDLRPWLERSRLFLLSSRYEGYAAVVVEALAAGRPVVATDCTPAATELLGVAGRGAVTPPGDADAMAAALRRTLDAPAPDPNALAAAVEGFRIGPIAREYLDLFDAVVSGRR